MKLQAPLRIHPLYFLLNTLEGALALFTLFRVASMQRNAMFLGFSLPRLVTAGLALAFLLVFLALFLLSLWKGGWLRKLDARLEHWLLAQDRLVRLALLLGVGFLCWAALLVFLNLPAGEALGMFQAVYFRAAGLFLWLAAFLLQTLLLLVFRFRGAFGFAGLRVDRTRQAQLVRFVLAAGIITALFALAAAIFFDLEQFYTFLNVFLLLASLTLVSLWLWQDHGQRALRTWLIALLVFVFTFAVYRAATFVVERPNTPAKAYFDLLADAWLHGRLYLTDPGQTHDLTLYQGQWYVANPPMVAVLMVPWVKMYTVAGVNTVIFSIVFGALNLALIFIILELMSARGWTRLSTGGNLWLTALFGFGTVHFYLSIVGKIWFMSQTVTVTFLALAVLLALASRPPWLAGMMLGFGIIARPNIALAWPLLFGITAQLQKDAGGRLDWRRLASWTVLSGLPMALAVGALLGYNYIRFNDFLNFGYLTENVADFMADDLKHYGTFNLHFIERNLRVMFLALPEWDPICRRVVPQHQGMSMLLATPALLYLVRALRRSPWVLGAWSALLALLALISTYYNTGAWQFGYKYMLDFAVPVIMLLAAAAGRRVSWPFRILILLSIASNIIGVLWWYGKWCVY
ncbi:MAG: hypothetical protein IT308_04245 [Anaerolineaceae bacterium]|nr:hypothetical protein [Anaerolineaceae bacterium]